jgi:hypothetical protein
MARPGRPRAAARWVLALLLTGGCDALTDVRAPRVVAASLEAPSPLVRRLEIRLARAAPLAVEYRAADGPLLRAESADASAHTLLLARLRPGRTYQYRVVGTDHAGTFATPPLPDDLAAIRLTATGRATVGAVLLHLYGPDGFRGYVAVDGEGEVVWYWRTADLPFGMGRRPNGNFVFLDKGRGIVEVSPAGEVVRELPQDVAGRGEMHHDLAVTPAGTVLVIAFDPRDHDGRTLLGEAVWEWNPEAGTAVKRWSAWDHFSPDADRGPRFGTEWMHANSLSIGPRGNVLIGIHYFDQVVSVAPGWGTVEWRLGGVNATIPLPEGEGFSGQHTAAEVADGRVLLFDNRFDRGGHSRAVELALSPAGATLAWEWSPTRPNFAAIVSSARRLENGNTVVGFGTSAGLVGSSGPVEAYEVSPAGQTVWHLAVDGVWLMYRAEPLESIAGETVVDDGG